MHQVSTALYVGPFASPARLPMLHEHKITHVLNVSDAPSVVSVDGHLREVAWQPILDLELIATDIAMKCLSTLHRMVCEPDARVYVHCIAGQNRSPTIVWLYYVACGCSADEARTMIERRVRDSVPGHGALVNEELLATVRLHGQQHFLPHPRELAIQAAV